MIAGVFGDDVSVGYKASGEADYLNLRSEYGKLIKIDSTPGVTVPITAKPFVGIEWTRNRRAKTVKLTQRNYIGKLAARFKGRYTLNELPYGVTELKRDEFEAFEVGTEETMMSREEYLEGIGSIGWAAVMTRPEIAYTFGVLSQFSMYARPVHFEAIMHTVGYLVNTPDMGLTFGGKLQIPMGLTSFPQHFHKNSGLWASSDSSWGRKPRPFGGHVVMRNNVSILWAANTS